jgi:hypothetical protein
LNLPVILSTQHRFKLFFENTERNIMYSFPGTMEMGVIRRNDGVLYDDLMKLLTILIASKWRANGPATPPPKIQSTLLPNISKQTPKNPPTHLKPAKQSQPTSS